MTRELYCLMVCVWDANDYLVQQNCNPLSADLYLFKSESELDEFAESIDYNEDVYNEGFMYKAELTEEEILDVTDFESIEDFDKAMDVRYDDVLGYYKTFEEKQKEKVCKHILDYYHNDECPIDLPNYNFDESIEGSIVVVWSWERYVGYARKCLDLRFADYGDTKAMLTKQDKVFTAQVDVVMTKEEVEEYDDINDLREELMDRLRGWKWPNPNFVESSVENFEL